MTVSLTHAFVSGKTDGADSTLVQPSNWNANHTITMAQGNILGRAAGAGTGAVSEIPLSFDASNNATFPAGVIHAAGTTTIAPASFQSGTNLTTAAAGSVEYDGKKLMFTPQGTQRGVVPGMQFYMLNSSVAGNNATGAQSLLGLSNGVTLSGSTIYAFELFVVLVKTAGTTTHTVSTLFGGTATLNSILYDVRVNDVPNAVNTYGASANQQGVTSNQASATVTTGNLTTAASYWSAVIKGIVSVNAGGTFHPQYSLSAAPGGAYTAQAGSYMLIYPIGASGSNVNVGTWA
ncbi:hypothetical protein [Caudoviricetes sp.]|nr:hypothetical protein [Caudoviricetes sp.]